MVAGGGPPRYRINPCLNLASNMEGSSGNFSIMANDFVREFLDIADNKFNPIEPDRPAIGNLTTAFCIERGLVENHYSLLIIIELINPLTLLGKGNDLCLEFC